MLNYKPSIGQRNGNDTPVSVREDGTLYGASIGGPIIHRLLTPKAPRQPVDTSLTDTSSWFYKQVTDYNFINGQDYYRVIYVGVDPDSSENEIIGTINTSVTNNFVAPTPEIQDLIDNALQIDIWSEGKFNFAAAVNNRGGILLEDEIDSTGIISPRAIWRKSVDINETLIPGEYYKIWVRVSCVEDERLLDYDGYAYNVTVGDLSIPIPKEIGRLNISALYSVNLDDLTDIDYILRETLPTSLDLNEIIKVHQKSEDINVFYFNSCQELNVLTMKINLDVSRNKYINTDLSELTGCIKESEHFTYTNFSECISMASSGMPSTGAPTSGECTTGTSGSSASPITEVIDGLLDCKFIVDIHASDKEDFNVFYILYNEFVTESTERDVARYGHKDYNWNTGVIKIDLRNVNDVLFESVDEGEVFNMTLFDETATFPMQDRHYWNSSVFIDDLFIMAGFDVEDCRLTNNRSFLTYIWEKDIVLDTPNFQKTQIPESERNSLTTIKNEANTAAYLDFSEIGEIDTNDTFVDRSIDQFADENLTNYVRMGSPHRHAVHHRFSSVTYDIPLRVDTFSATWSFGIDQDCPCIIDTNPPTGSPSPTGTPGPTGNPGTTGTTGFPATGGPPTTGNPDLPLQFSPYFLHMLFQDDFDAYVADPYPIVNPFNRNFKDTFISMFKINCNGNTENPAITVQYNFHTNTWKIITENRDAEWVRSFVTQGPRPSLDFDNVFTINTWRKQVYGCGKKYLLDFNLYVNGQSLFDGITYTDSTTDTYVLTHNHDEEFSGYISYLEVRDGLLEEGHKYAVTMFQTLCNIAWAELEEEVQNESGPRGLEFFSFRRNLILNNLNWDNADDFIFPIVLQGNSYNVGELYNTEVRRSIFDFNKIDVNNPSFSFAYEGTSNLLEWEASAYDFNSDIMVVWVKLPNWRGQRITMFYGDIRVIRDETINKLYDGYYGFWTMSKFQTQAQVRFNSNQIYDGGEAIVVASNENGTFTLQLDKQYFFGNSQIYKSNQFDIAYDDRQVHRNREEDVNDFVRDSVDFFRPGTMTLRDIKGIFPLKIEADNVGSDQ